MRLSRIAIVVCLSLIFIGSLDVSVVSFEYDINKKSNSVNSSLTTVLVTGFESYLNIYNPNPSQFIAENFSKQVINGAKIVNITIPVLWGEAVNVITKAIIDYNPDIVISIGAGMINSIRIEKVGINLKSCRMPDNNGMMFLLRRIDPDGPFLRFSPLSVKSIVEKINQADIPAVEGYHAGTFICNEVLYGVLNFVENNDLSIKTGFIHVPLLKSQDPEQGLELSTMIEAVTIAISVCLEDLEHI